MSAEMKKPLKIGFAPGVLEDLESKMCPDELQEFMDLLKARAEDGSLMEDSKFIDFDELQLEDPEEYEKLMKVIESMPEEVSFDSKRTLN